PGRRPAPASRRRLLVRGGPAIRTALARGGLGRAAGRHAAALSNGIGQREVAVQGWTGPSGGAKVCSQTRQAASGSTVWPVTAKPGVTTCGAGVAPFGPKSNGTSKVWPADPVRRTANRQPRGLPSAEARVT